MEKKTTKLGNFPSEPGSSKPLAGPKDETRLRALSVPAREVGTPRPPPPAGVVVSLEWDPEQGNWCSADLAYVGCVGGLGWFGDARAG